ncbi:hypothetical protein JQ625_07040 [Bradyrhizobium diazoefficiens]|nr:hypothetical protein [Bradyrhizobium diazoefficiens]MBR0774579.1 hypothetical protein [Bradyrhizobium diazoefficiens]
MSSGLGMLPGRALKTLCFRMEWLATAMPRVDWAVPAPLGCVVLPVRERVGPWLGFAVVVVMVQARMALRLGFVVVVMVRARMALRLGFVVVVVMVQARMALRLGFVVVLMVQARMALWLGFVAASKLVGEPGAQAEQWPAEQPGVRQPNLTGRRAASFRPPPNMLCWPPKGRLARRQRVPSLFLYSSPVFLHRPQAHISMSPAAAL